jgi:hypothetical protein
MEPTNGQAVYPVMAYRYSADFLQGLPMETDREEIMNNLKEAAEMVLECFDNDYGQLAKDCALADLRRALNDKEESILSRDKVAALIDQIPKGLDADDFLVELANLAASTEREACAKLCDQISDEDGFEGGYADNCANQIRQRGDQ